MTDPQVLDGRRIHAFLILAGEPQHQCAVTGLGSWDGAHLTLVPDGRQPSLPVPLIEGRAPVHELTPAARATIESLDTENSETWRNALTVADYLGVWLVSSLPDWATPVLEPLSVAWVPGWPSS